MLTFSSVCSKLVRPENNFGGGPHRLLSHVANYLDAVITQRSSRPSSDYYDVVIKPREDYVKDTLLKWGLNDDGELVGDSVIHDRMADLLKEVCPNSLNENDWGGLNFSIWQDPLHLLQMGGDVEKAKMIWSAYFFITAVGEIAAAGMRKNIDKVNAAAKHLEKASLLRPNEPYIQKCYALVEEDILSKLRILEAVILQKNARAGDINVPQFMLFGTVFAVGGFFIGFIPAAIFFIITGLPEGFYWIWVLICFLIGGSISQS